MNRKTQFAISEIGKWMLALIFLAIFIILILLFSNKNSDLLAGLTRIFRFGG